jgi:peptidoglycan/LPS O-acetylase OafA/YrhL
VLTTLRFPAAFAIVLYHFLAYTPCPRWVWDGFNTGVSFFYVLSGFILYYNYLDLKDRGFFWVARFARIWPVHIVTLILAFLVMPFDRLLGHASWPVTLPANILLVHAWLPFKGAVLSFNGVSWSLSVEAFFYLCFPWLLACLNRRGSPLLLGASFGLGFVIILLATLYWPDNAPYVSTFNPVCRIFEFVLGMATCKFWLEGKAKRAIDSGVWLERELLVIVVSLVLVVALPAAVMESNLANPTTSWLAAEACALGFAALIWVFAHEAGPISKALSKRFLTWLGEISFAVYMCHQIILRKLMSTNLTDTFEILRKFTLLLVLTLIVAAAIFHLVETPTRHAIVAAFKRRFGTARHG